MSAAAADAFLHPLHTFTAAANAMSPLCRCQTPFSSLLRSSFVAVCPHHAHIVALDANGARNPSCRSAALAVACQATSALPILRSIQRGLVLFPPALPVPPHSTPPCTAKQPRTQRCCALTHSHTTDPVGPVKCTPLRLPAPLLPARSICSNCGLICTATSDRERSAR